MFELYRMVTAGFRLQNLGEAVSVAEWVRSLYFTAVSGVGSSPALATCETSQILLAGVSGGFPGVLPFRPTYRLARLYE